MTTETRTRPATGSSRQTLTVLLTCVANFMVTLDALVVVTALPSIHRSLGGDITTLQWTLTAYAMAFGAGIMTASALGDRFGRRRVYVFGLAVFTAASAMCALAPNAGLLIGFRVLQGIGAACVMPLGMTLLTSAFPPERRGAVVGLWQGIAGLAVASGPLVGGALTQGASWHWIFWVNVPVGVLAAIGARLYLKESYGPRNPLDLPALVLVTVGVGTLIWGVVSGGQDGWGSTGNVVGIAVGLAALGGFVRREARVRHPMIPLSLFANRTFSSAVGTQFLMSASIYAAAFVISEFFQLGLGNSPLTAGLEVPAVDGHAAGVRAVGGRSVRSRRSARAGRPGAPDAGGRLCVDRVTGGEPRWLLELHRAVCDRRHRDLPVDAVRGRRRSERRAAQSVGQGCRHDQHASAVRGGVRRRNRDGGVQRPREPGKSCSGGRRLQAGARRRGRALATGRGCRDWDRQEQGG